MPGTVTLVRPDGTTIDVRKEDAEVLKGPGIGYKEQTPAGELTDASEAGKEAYYTTPGQRVTTALEGTASGISLGGSDLLFHDEDSRNRALYNPGLRLGAEFIGGFGAPVGMLGDAAAALGGSSRLASGAFRGIAEGAQFGAGSAVTNAELSAQPLSIEAVAAGAGWGSIFGGGLGAVAGAVESKVAAKRAAVAKAVEATEAHGAVAEEKFAAVSGAVDDARAQMNKAVREVRASGDGINVKGIDLKPDTNTGVNLPGVEARASAATTAEGQQVIKGSTFSEAAGLDPDIAQNQVIALKPEAQLAATKLGAEPNKLEDGAAWKSKAGSRQALQGAEWSGDQAAEPQTGKFKTPKSPEEALVEAKPGHSGKEYLDEVTNEGLVNKGSRDVVRRAYKTYGKIVDAAAAGKFEKVEAMMHDFHAQLVEVEKATLKELPGHVELDSFTRKLGDLTDRASGITPDGATAFESEAASAKSARAPEWNPKEPAADITSTGKVELPKGEPVEGATGKFKATLPDKTAAYETPLFQRVMADPAMAMRQAASKAAVEESVKMASAAALFSHFPTTADGLGTITKATAEKLSGAFDQVMSLKSAEMAGVQAGLKRSMQDLVDHVGIKVNGSPGEQFRKLWDGLNGAAKASGVSEATKIAEGKSGWFKQRLLPYMAGGLASSAAKGLGAKGVMRLITYDAVKNMTYGLLGVKGAVLGAVGKGVSKWAPAGAKALRIVGPRVEPFKTRLDGTVDNVRGTREEMMRARANEIRNAAPSVKDTLYRSLQPMDRYHPDLASGLHALSVTQFKFLLDKLPQDPGHAYSGLKSLWKPDAAAVEKFGRYYEVFHDPVGVITRALEKHSVTPEAVEGLREMWPELYTELRSQMLVKISDPKVMKSMSYQEQVHMGLLLDIPIHSSMTPQFIASQTQMYKERNQKPSIPPQPGASGGGGRPPGPGATQAQKVTEH